MRSQQGVRSKTNMPENPQSLALEPFRIRYEACFDLCRDLPRLEFSGIQPLWPIFTRIVVIPLIDYRDGLRAFPGCRAPSAGRWRDGGRSAPTRIAHAVALVR